MKKNINYKNITLMALLWLMTSGCAHKNIVQSVTMNKARLKDIKTGKERVYDCSNAPAMQSVLIWVAKGDIISLESGKYAFDTVFTPQNSYISCDYVELQRRKTEFEKNKLKYEIQMNYPKQNNSK